MKINVSFIGVLSGYVGAEQAIFELPDGSSASDLMTAIGEKFRDNMSSSIWSGETNCFTGPVIFLKNDQLLTQDRLVLAEGDEIKMMLGLAGG